jgi:hypothetical protein
MSAMKRVITAMFLLVGMAAWVHAQSAPAPAILGEWEITTLSPVGECTNTVEFKKDGDTLKAVAKSPQGERPYDSVQLDGAKLTLVLTIDFQGQPMVITYQGTVEEKAINGAADFGGLAMGSFSAKRKDAAQ